MMRITVYIPKGMRSQEQTGLNGGGNNHSKRRKML